VGSISGTAALLSNGVFFALLLAVVASVFLEVVTGVLAPVSDFSGFKAVEGGTGGTLHCASKS
jgi:hypothetical protein